MAPAGLKVPSGLSDLLSQLSPPALNQPPPHDLDELSLVSERQFVNGVQKLCKAHGFFLTQLFWTV
ncbi:MAG: hypothetical protein ACJ76J_16795 [Thermoanaerobaculia bacterium]